MDFVRSGGFGYLIKAFAQVVRKEKKEKIPDSEQLKIVIITTLNNVETVESTPSCYGSHWVKLTKPHWFRLFIFNGTEGKWKCCEVNQGFVPLC